MKPDFRIEANGADITARIRDRLLDLRITDEAGLASDRLELVLDDRDHEVPLPPRNAEFRVWVGYRPPGMLPAYMGRFKLDEIEVGSGPRSMTIRAKAAEGADGTEGRFREPKSRSWHDTTIGGIVGAIAAEHGFRPRVSEALAPIAIAHIDQTEESDAAFLTRLAEKNGAVAKPADGTLVFVGRGEGRTASGVPAPALTLRPEDVTSWKARLAERGVFGTVEAYWQDHASGERKAVRVGSGEPVYRDRLQYAGEDEARRAAESRRRKSEGGKGTVDLTLPGRPALFAEGDLHLTGFRPEVDGAYSIKSVEHSLNDQSYSSRVSAETRDGGAG